MTSLNTLNVCNEGYYCDGGAMTPNPNGPYTTLSGEAT